MNRRTLGNINKAIVDNDPSLVPQTLDDDVHHSAIPSVFAREISEHVPSLANKVGYTRLVCVVVRL